MGSLGLESVLVSSVGELNWISLVVRVRERTLDGNTITLGLTLFLSFDAIAGFVAARKK